MTSYCGLALRRVLGVATAVAALLAVPSLASAADETFSLAGVLKVPGAALVSFDISWVDTTIKEYFLADRNNKSIDVVPITASPPVFQIIPTGNGAFAGSPGVKFPCHSGAGPNDCAGPDGVITFFNTHSNQVELWVGDGPTTNSACISGQPFCSTVKVFAGADAHLVTLINTFGNARADELCVDTKDHVVLVANDADAPAPFVTLINTDNYSIIAHIVFDGAPGNGPNATNGIEQCQWRSADGNFYLNIPEVNGHPADPDGTPGAVVVITPTAGIVKTFPVDITKCAGPQGMAIGPDPQILLGCNAPTSVNGGTLNGTQNSVIINANTGVITTTLTDQGGADEVWFEPGSKHYFIAEGSHVPSEQIGVIDSTTTTGPTADPQPLNNELLLVGGGFPGSTGTPVNQQAIFVGFAGTTTRRAHSVAAWSGNISGAGNLTAAFVPIPQVGGTTATVLAPFSSVLCDPIETSGCIAVFTSNTITEEVGE